MKLLTTLLIIYAAATTALVIVLLLSRRRQRRRYQRAIREALRRKMDSEAVHKQLLQEAGIGQEEEEVPPARDAFFEAFCEVVRENASNPELDIPEICRKMLVSRSKLYAKITPVAGMSPKHYLQNWRLQRAASLLAEGKMNISEVAEASGFNSLSYFSKSFKRLYGVSPKEY